MRKRTLTVPDRNYTSSTEGHLPRRVVSVAAAPWEEATEPPAPVEEKPKGPILKGPRPGKLKPDAK